MKKQLISVIQQAIVLYVASAEKREYNFNHHYDLDYINHSKIHSIRKRNIREIDKLLNQSSLEEWRLAKEVYDYLHDLPLSLRDIIRGTMSRAYGSALRDHIYRALYAHDEILFFNCGRLDMEGMEKKYVDVFELPDDSLLVKTDLEVQQAELVRENTSLKEQIEDLGEKLSDERDKNAVLMQNLKQALKFNEQLKKRVDTLLKKRKQFQETEQQTLEKPPQTAAPSEPPNKENILSFR